MEVFNHNELNKLLIYYFERWFISDSKICFFFKSSPWEAQGAAWFKGWSSHQLAELFKME